VIFEIILALSYLLAGPGAWGLYGYLMHNGRRKMLLLKSPPDPRWEGQTPPVTILVPAKDEEQRIRGCLMSVLAQDYPDVEVIAINDRSRDKTGAVMDKIAAINPRLKVLHIQEGSLQPGWTGKNNALFQGQKLARGRWLLFVDSDVVLEPDALTTAMSVVINRNYDLLSLLPKLESHSTWESLLVPLAAGAASTMYLVPLCNSNYMKNTAFANGQFLLIKRETYDRIGQHAVVKDRYCEDIAIAMIVKKSGMRPRVSWGREWARVRMYSSLADIFKGWSRIYYSAKVGSPRAILAGVGFILNDCFTFFPAAAWAVYRVVEPVPGYAWLTWAWVAAAVAHFGLMVHFIGTLYEWSGNPRRNAWAWPVSLAMLLAIMFRALKMCVTKKVEWRGTTYAHTMASNLPTPP
jgi:glycosyltransferase involved in cell wall biosynthesis